MKHHRTTISAFFFTLLSSVVIGACLDFTPITVPPGDAGAVDDAYRPDADWDSGACRSCVEMPACSDKFAACVATPKCVVMFECGAAHHCYAPGSDLVACLTICGQVAALTGSTDPAVAPFLSLYQCATTQCASSCAKQ